MMRISPRLGIVADLTQSPSCQEGRDELVMGFAALSTALFFFAWTSFDLAFLLVFVAAPMLFGSRFLAKTPVGSWLLPLQGALLGVLAVMAAVRLATLSSGGLLPTAGSDVERWLPLLLSSLVPLWFVISGVLNRLPRHLVAGIVAVAGAAAGPWLGLAWRDSLALAAAVLGVVLLVDGGVARNRVCLPDRA